VCVKVRPHIFQQDNVTGMRTLEASFLPKDGAAHNTYFKWRKTSCLSMVMQVNTTYEYLFKLPTALL